ncbi:MGMT family protein [Halioxenophilus sp. WMMB6]|uniref:MGMT family protein n=1 Tax=Halioxenophilus sp. WMMB6 TaxID=3073815 RepID=UPI00295E9E56|nr:MGMT family protein [Halioxenophilus sp. WMMB6]
MEQRLAALYLVLSQIPVGRVTTYGDLAKLIGLANGARWVGRTLGQLPQESQLPWHRVINSQGRISLPDERGQYQKGLLQAEGIVFTGERTSLARYRWRP